MDPLIAKIIYMSGYWVANFVIRIPHSKTHGRLPIQANHNTRADTSLFLALSLGGFLVPFELATKRK